MFAQEKLAKELGIATKTLNNKLRKGVFRSDEIEKMIVILEIKNPTEIFSIKLSYLMSKDRFMRVNYYI